MVSYVRLFKKIPNLKNPKTFSEYIISRMSCDTFRKLSLFADKVAVEDYVRRAIGEQYLVPLKVVYDSPDKIDYHKINDSDYIKCNHGSGYNICYNSAKKLETQIKLDFWFRTDFSKFCKELQYLDIPRKIIIQENVSQPAQQFRNFNFWNFHGKTEFVQIWDNHNHRYEVDENWKPLPFQLFSTSTEIEEKPKQFYEMLCLAAKLSKPFPFVRVDLFLADENIYFSELTFSPGAGIKRFTPDVYNDHFGSLLRNQELQ